MQKKNTAEIVIKSAKDFAHLSTLSTVEISGLQVHEAFQPVLSESMFQSGFFKPNSSSKFYSLGRIQSDI